MGWARYVHSMRVFVFNSGLFYIRPTEAALALLDRVAARLEAENGWDQAIFNEVCRAAAKLIPTYLLLLFAAHTLLRLQSLQHFASTFAIDLGLCVQQ